MPSATMPRPPAALPTATPASAAQPASHPLLTAPLLPLLLRFALPNMGAMLATAPAAVAETACVGSFGVSALAGMALVFPLVMLQMVLSSGAMGGGVSSAVSRAIGAGGVARASALALHALWIALTVGALYLVLMLAFGPALFALLGGRGEALAQALAFCQVAFLGAVGVWLVNTWASVIRGSGNMAVPSATLLAVSLGQVLVGGALAWGWACCRAGAWRGWRWARWRPMPLASRFCGFTCSPAGRG